MFVGCNENDEMNKLNLFKLKTNLFKPNNLYPIYSEQKERERAADGI
jgi:hypothetical protein